MNRLKEFYNDIDIGQEFSFGYGNREFILSQSPDKIFIVIVEHGKKDIILEFESAEDIAENLILDGKKFKDVINKIEF